MRRSGFMRQGRQVVVVLIVVLAFLLLGLAFLNQQHTPGVYPHPLIGNRLDLQIKRENYVYEKMHQWLVGIINETKEAALDSTMHCFPNVKEFLDNITDPFSSRCTSVEVEKGEFKFLLYKHHKSDGEWFQNDFIQRGHFAAGQMANSSPERIFSGRGAFSNVKSAIHERKEAFSSLYKYLWVIVYDPSRSHIHPWVVGTVRIETVAEIGTKHINVLASMWASGELSLAARIINAGEMQISSTTVRGKKVMEWNGSSGSIAVNIFDGNACLSFGLLKAFFPHLIPKHVGTSRYDEAMAYLIKGPALNYTVIVTLLQELFYPNDVLTRKSEYYRFIYDAVVPILLQNAIFRFLQRHVLPKAFPDYTHEFISSDPPKILYDEPSFITFIDNISHAKETAQFIWDLCTRGASNSNKYDLLTGRLDMYDSLNDCLTAGDLSSSSLQPRRAEAAPPRKACHVLRQIYQPKKL